MQLSRIAIVIALLAATLAFAPIPAFAQSPAKEEDHSAHHPATEQAPAAKPAADGMASGGMMMGDMGRMMTMMHGGQAMGMPMRHIEGRIAFLKAELKLTPAQEPQWNAFAAAIRAGAKSGQGMMHGMMADKTKAQTAPAMLDGYERVLVSRLEAIRAIRAAFTPLYAVLTAEQRKVADELLASPMGPM